MAKKNRKERKSFSDRETDIFFWAQVARQGDQIGRFFAHWVVVNTMQV
jgi:hypothetical protein